MFKLRILNVEIFEPLSLTKSFQNIIKMSILNFFCCLSCKHSQTEKTFQNDVKFAVTKKSKIISRTMLKLNTFCWLEILFLVICLTLFSSLQLSYVWKFVKNEEVFLLRFVRQNRRIRIFSSILFRPKKFFFLRKISKFRS